MSISHLISNLSQQNIKLIRKLLIPVEVSVAVLDLIYPKNNKTVIFGSNTGEYASGSPKALHDHIKSRHEDYHAYYYLPFQGSMKPMELIKYVFKFLPKFLSARFLVASHPTNDFFPFGWSRRKKLVNLWHGTPLKSLFYADSGESDSNLKEIKKLADKTSVFTVSSKLEAALITECFLMDPRKIICTGHPRNDALLMKTEKRLSALIENLPEYKKIILYCPTYRRDGSSKFFPFPDMDMENLKNYLEENQLVILIRGHVYNELDESEGELFSDRIIDFGFDRCNDVNSILGEVDVLITDYSSIYIDYLLLDRPCLFIPYDLHEYMSNRGLLLDDYDFWTPGAKINTYREFLDSLNDIKSGIDDYKDKRRDISLQFHYYDKGNASENVFKWISECE